MPQSQLPALDLPYRDPNQVGSPEVGRAYVMVNLNGQLTIKLNDGSIIPVGIAPAVSNVNNSAGDTLLSGIAPLQNQFVAFTGAGRTSNIILDIVGIAEGTQLNLTITLPGNPDFVIPIRNATSTGTVLATLQNPGDPSIASGAFTFVFDSGAWSITRAQVPAY